MSTCKKTTQFMVFSVVYTICEGSKLDNFSREYYELVRMEMCDTMLMHLIMIGPN